MKGPYLVKPSGIRYWKKGEATRRAMSDTRETGVSHYVVDENTGDVVTSYRHRGIAGGIERENPSSPNPRRVKLPSKFTMMPVRVNKKGEVQIGVNPNQCKSGRVARNVKRIEARAVPKKRRATKKR